MDNLIPVINKLQDVFATVDMEGIQLPQIAVVGIQSSGKTSVLESFVGKEFLPRGEGLVTRCPIILQLVYEPDCEETWCEFHHRPGEYYADFGAVEQEIRAQMNQLAGTSSGIVNKPIRLKVHSSSVVDLTVVDLPGIVKVPVGDQPQQIETDITNMILEYIQNKNCIILAICAADQDLPTSEAIKLARQVDPTGSRTMTVLTKLDRAVDVNLGHKVLSGQLISTKHGIIGVVNRSRVDVAAGKSIKDGKLDEKIFLRENYPSLAAKNGSEYLANQLSNLLKAHVIERLHTVEAAIGTLVDQFQRRMEALGGDDLPADKSRTLVDIIMHFTDAYKAEIDGKTRNIQRKRLYACARIGYVFEQTFPHKLAQVDPLEGLSDEEISCVLFNSRGLPSQMFTPEDAYQSLLSDQLQKFRDLSLECADMVNEEMLRLINNCVESEHVRDVVSRFPKLREELVQVSTELLRKQIKIARARVEEYINSLASFIRTFNPDFQRVLEEHMANLDLTRPLIHTQQETSPAPAVVVNDNANLAPAATEGSTPAHPLFPRVGKTSRPTKPTHDQDRSMIQIVRDLMTAYFDHERKRVQDEIPRILVHHVVYFTQQQIGRELYNSLHTPETADQLIQVSDEMLAERTSTSEMLEKLKQGAQIIQDVRAGGN